MNNLLAIHGLFSDVVVERLGWVLVHSLWQFTLVALFAFLLLSVMRRCTAETRYGALACLWTFSMVLPIATWTLQRSQPATVAAIPLVVVEDAQSESPPSVDRPIATAMVRRTVETAEGNEVFDASPTSVFTPAVSTPPQSTWSELSAAILRPWLAGTVGIWGLGVVLCSLRPLLGWFTLPGCSELASRRPRTK